MIFFMVFSGNQNVAPQFDKGVKGGYFTLTFSTAVLILWHFIWKANLEKYDAYSE